MAYFLSSQLDFYVCLFEDITPAIPIGLDYIAVVDGDVQAFLNRLISNIDFGNRPCSLSQFEPVARAAGSGLLIQEQILKAEQELQRWS